MARAVFLNAELTGKLGGQVYARNKGGAYVRAHVVPTNPRTVRQQKIRSGFSSSAKTWNVITQADRNAWNAYAATFFTPKKVKPGVTYSGFSAFQSLFNTQIQLQTLKRGLTITTPTGITIVAADATPRTTAPTGLFSGQLTGAAGKGILQTLSAATLTSAGVFSATFALSEATPSTGPTWIDPGSSRKFGYLFFGNMPGSSSPRDLIALGWTGLPGAPTGWTTAVSSFKLNFAALDIDLSQRKLWYAVGNKCVVTAYAVSEVGESAPLGTYSLIVT
jgi:hypothetical protein